MPEPLMILFQLRRYNTLYWPGGYAAQPYILMLEFEACAAGENALEERRRINLEAQIKYLASKVGKQTS